MTQTTEPPVRGELRVDQKQAERTEGLLRDASLSPISGLPGGSLGGRLDDFGQIGPGFDNLRVSLSIAVLLWHSFALSGDGIVQSRLSLIYLSFISTILPMFFALSGFLVMGSALRIADLRTFIVFRVLRIVPALATEITLSAIILGPVLTSRTFSGYFWNTETIQYFGSLLGRVRYNLPGVFDHNPVPGTVNGALWTVAPEIFCYVLMSGLIITTAFSRPRILIWLAAISVFICLVIDWIVPPEFNELLPRKSLVLAFLSGAIIFSSRYRLPYSLPAAAVAFIGAVGMLIIGHKGPAAFILTYPAVGLLAYCIAILGLTKLPRLPFFHTGDYSYGMYIFGFPIQQSLVQFFPAHRSGWFTFSLALPVTLICATLSWRYVEKPFLSLRKNILGTRPRMTPIPPHRWNWGQKFVAAMLVAYGIFILKDAQIIPTTAFKHLLENELTK